MANVDAPVRDWCDPHDNTYLNNAPEGRNERSPRSGTIAIFAILTPPSEGPKTARNEPELGSLPFNYVSRIDMYKIEITTYLQHARGGDLYPHHPG